MKVLGMCIDKKVVAGVAAVGLGVWWLAPGAVGAALPFLLLAVCPLSMLVMMKAMNAGQDGQPPSAHGPAAVGAADGRSGDVGSVEEPVPPVAATHPRARWN